MGSGVSPRAHCAVPRRLGDCWLAEKGAWVRASPKAQSQVALRLKSIFVLTYVLKIIWWLTLSSWAPTAALIFCTPSRTGRWVDLSDQFESLCSINLEISIYCHDSIQHACLQFCSHQTRAEIRLLLNAAPNEFDIIYIQLCCH